MGRNSLGVHVAHKVLRRASGPLVYRRVRKIGPHNRHGDQLCETSFRNRCGGPPCSVFDCTQNNRYPVRVHTRRRFRCKFAMRIFAGEPCSWSSFPSLRVSPPLVGTYLAVSAIGVFAHKKNASTGGSMCVARDATFNWVAILTVDFPLRKVRPTGRFTGRGRVNTLLGALRGNTAARWCA